MLKEKLYILLSGLLAGIFIAIGCTVNLSIIAGGGNEFWAKIVGALFFGLGLFSVIQFQTWLYTGKVGFVLDHKPNYIIVISRLLLDQVEMDSICLLILRNSQK